MERESHLTQLHRWKEVRTDYRIGVYYWLNSTNSKYFELRNLLGEVNTDFIPCYQVKNANKVTAEFIATKQNNLGQIHVLMLLVIVKHKLKADKICN